MSGPQAPDCLFCRIVRREAPARILFEDDRVLAFEDIRPQAPVHVLVVPKLHIASLNDAPAAAEDLLGACLAAARRAARDKGIAESGYRVVLNTGPHAGQAVYHVHFHVVGGRPLEWPPG